MNALDWGVLFLTLGFIVVYGTYRSRGTKTMEGYLKGDQDLKWWMIGISIMATQASAVTFLSTPGQAVEDGMRFLQFYMGLPIAMIIISVSFVPIYYKLKVYTAYEYLESRFDLKTRLLAAIFFLFLRGLSDGITLYAPSIVLSTILGVPIYYTTVGIGLLVVIYTVSGGTKAVNVTQRQQMAIIMGGMILAGILAFNLLPDNVSFKDTLAVAGHMGRLNLINFDFSLSDRYNVWSGLIAGTFLFLSYFGTDQSQVARYLGGSSVTESRMGLIFNGLLKVPMQFIILFIGVLVFVFFMFNKAPVFHNEVLYREAVQASQGGSLQTLGKKYDSLFAEKQTFANALVDGIHSNDAAKIASAQASLMLVQGKEKVIRDSVRSAIKASVPGVSTQDRDYIFLNFVLKHLPHGIIGLILAVMFSAAMSSMASELNALSSTTTIDIYKRIFNREASPQRDLAVSRLFTMMWALFAMTFSMLASFSENLIQFVNIIGSLFYGTILGIFVVAFYFKFVKATAVFWAAIVAELVVLYCFFKTDLAFLLYNIIACGVVVILSSLIQFMIGTKPQAKS